MSRISLAEFRSLVEAELPLVRIFGMAVESLDRGRAVLTLAGGEGAMRPGGTMAGPLLFALADVTLYAVTLSIVGHVPLAVTTNLNINFLNKPGLGLVRAEGRVLKAGKRLIVGECSILDGQGGGLLAHATGTYSIPPGKA
ncbi:MAG: PaaI family thioesterase [Alphaproteobacteria bacterium]